MAPVPIRPVRRLHGAGRAFGKFAEPGDQSWTIAMQAQQVSELRRQFVEQNDFAAAAFVEHFDLDAVAELGARPRFQRADVLDHRAVADLVVGEVHTHVHDPDVIAHHAVMDAGVLDDGRLGRRRLRHAAYRAETDLSAKPHVDDACAIEFAGHLHARPVVVLGRASVLCERRDFDCP